MVAQWVKDRSRAIKGTAKAKRIGADLRADKAAKKARQLWAEKLNEYQSLSGRAALGDFEEWMGCRWILVKDQYNEWLDLRIAELRNGYDWAKDID